jgi:hypothetical protein
VQTGDAKQEARNFGGWVACLEHYKAAHPDGPLEDLRMRCAARAAEVSGAAVEVGGPALTLRLYKPPSSADPDQLFAMEGSNFTRPCQVVMAAQAKVVRALEAAAADGDQAREMTAARAGVAAARAAANKLEKGAGPWAPNTLKAREAVKAAEARRAKSEEIQVERLAAKVRSHQ